MIYTITLAEIEAARLLYGRYFTGDIHKAADEIILLAEQIKSSRAVAAMQPSIVQQLEEKK